jgi:hypothetical protein
LILWNEIATAGIRRRVEKVNPLLLFGVPEVSIARQSRASESVDEFFMLRSSRTRPGRSKHRLAFYVQILSRSAASRRGSGDEELRILGSARGSRACDGGLAIANFSGIP